MPFSPACTDSRAHQLAALGEGVRLWVPGCLVTWSAPAMYTIHGHILCLGSTDHLPCSPGTECWALCSPRAARTWNGVSPWPLASWPCSLFPEATWAQEEVLATEAGCKGTALPPDLSTNVLLEVWERWPPTLSATKPLLLYGPHPLLYLLLAYSEWPLPPLDPGEKLTSDTSVPQSSQL